MRRAGRGHRRPAPAEHADHDWLEAIERHMTEHAGPAEWVFHELVSDLVHVDVHVVPAREGDDHHVLYTTGCSALAMKVPEGVDSSPHAELMVNLPAWWKLGQEHFKDERWYWPIRWLKLLARLPHEHRTWLGWGHSIPNGDPPKRFDASTRLAGVILFPSMTYFEGSRLTMPGGDRQVDFWALYPLYPEEIDYKLAHGAGELFNRFEDAELTDVVDPERKPVV
jgi:hypothetical protein